MEALLEAVRRDPFESLFPVFVIAFVLMLVVRDVLRKLKRSKQYATVTEELAIVTVKLETNTGSDIIIDPIKNPDVLDKPLSAIISEVESTIRKPRDSQSGFVDVELLTVLVVLIGFLICLGTIVYLSVVSQPVPDILQQVTSGLLGVIVGMKATDKISEFRAVPIEDLQGKKKM